MAVEQWALRALDQTQSNPSKTIQLAADGVVYQTWGLPFPSADEFCEEARAVLAAFAEESPKGKRVPVLFSAIGADGQITTQQPSSFIGKNVAADALVGSGNGAAKAFAESMTLQVGTMNVLLKAAQTMVEASTKSAESYAEQLVDMRDYIKTIHEIEIKRLEKAAAASPSTGGFDMPEVVKEQLAAALPLALEAAELWLKGKANSPASTAAKAVVTGINQVTNGVPQS